MRGFQRIAATAADAKDADAVGIHAGILRQDVGGAVDVLDAVGGFVHVARLALASALIGGIKGKTDVALFRHPLTVQSGHLLLTSSVGMRHDKGGINLRCVISGRGIDVGDNLQAVQVVVDAVNVHLAQLVLGNGSPINQPERIVVGALNSGEVHRCKRLLGLCDRGACQHQSGGTAQHCLK